MHSSRRVHEMHATTISMYKSDLKDKILEAAKSDQHYVEIKKNYNKVFCSRKLKIMS
jgi:hypothetical protein